MTKAKNRLSLETSPYLLQHQDNPVDWYPWGPEALEAAKTTGKPILLSIGYSACHWCHVMAHESFEDEAIAGVMNTHFINIKVDREERPDLDTLYQSALQIMSQRGGWPLTMMLTPNGEPFWGGTYFPSTPRYGYPSFPEILTRIAGVWNEDQNNVQDNVKQILNALDHLDTQPSSSTLTLGTLDPTAAVILNTCDRVYGSFQGAPKFPQVPTLTFLWQAWQRSGQIECFDQVNLTLNRMANGGIYDHLGGGFARYSTDERWLVPHFEKMLYDNAQLIELMCAVYKETKSVLLEHRIAETITWLLRDMTVSGPNDSFAFATALDADSEGEEGLYYVWSETEIDDVLGTDADLFKRTYDVSATGNWDEGPLRENKPANILNRPSSVPLAPTQDNQLATARQKLLDNRDTRIPPGRDDKVLAELNGMMIKALSTAAHTFDKPDWANVAKDVFFFVSSNLSHGEHLKRCWSGGASKHTAVLDDIAHMAAAALTLYEASGEDAYLDSAKSWVRQADDLHKDKTGGGYYLSSTEVTDIFKRSKPIYDNATPAANGVLADVLVRLFLITGLESYRHSAETLIEAMTTSDPTTVAHMPTVLGAFERLAQGTQVVVVGTLEETKNLVRAALQTPLAQLVIIHANEQTTILASNPAFQKTRFKGLATAYVCSAGTCAEPVTTPQDLIEALNNL